MIVKTHIALLALLIGCVALPAQAKQPHDGPDGSEREMHDRDNRGLDRAVGQVQRDTGGRVLSADVDERGGDRSYRVKVLTPNGRVRVITVDGER